MKVLAPLLSCLYLVVFLLIAGCGKSTAASYGSGCGASNPFYGNIDPNNEEYLRILTRGQAYYDSATHQINILQGNNPNPGFYLQKIINKDFANQRLVLRAHGQNFTGMTGPECFAQSQKDWAAIAAVIATENDTIPESNTNGGIMLEGEPYYHHTLQANAAGFNPLIRLGTNEANNPNPGPWLSVWIKVAADCNTFANYVAGTNTSLDLCKQMNIMLGNAFLAFLHTPASGADP